MSEPVIAHRFQRLHPLSSGEGAQLFAARDIATDVAGTLLVVRAEAAEALEVAVRFRLSAFAGRPLFRRLAPLVVLRADSDLYVFLPGLRGEPWEPFLLGLPGAAALLELESVRVGLEALARDGSPGGGLRITSLWRDEQGPCFLPDAYALAPVPREGLPTFQRQVDPVASAAEVERLRAELADVAARYRRVAGERMTAAELEELERCMERLVSQRVEPSPMDACAASLVSAVAELQQDGGAVLVRGGPRRRREALDAVRAWAMRMQRPLLALQPHAGPADVAPQSADESPGGRIVLLDGFDAFPPFAEGLARLAAHGWFDGRETLVVSLCGSGEDGAAALYLAGLRHRGPGSAREVEVGPDGDPAHSTPALTPSGTHRRVQEALVVAGRPLSESLVRQAFGIAAEEMAEAALELFRSGGVEVIYARPDEAPAGVQLLLGLPPGFDAQVPEERAHEIGRLLASALDGLNARPGLGGDWLRLQAAIANEPQRAPALTRKLAARARQEDSTLLEYAAYEQLLRVADRARPKLEDRCQAAKVMGEQHRLRGDLDTADRLFADALAAVESSTDLPDARLAPLAAELILKIAFLAQHRADYREAERLLAEGLDRYEEHLPVIHRAHIYLDLASARLKLGRTREAADSCELVLKILDAERYPLEVARAYNALGLILYEESNYSQSLVNLQRGLVLREQAGQVQEVARSYNNLSLAYRGLGRFSEAEGCLKRSLELKIKLGDMLGVAATQLNLGYLAIDQSNFGQAHRCGLECLHLARRLRHRQMEAEAHGLLGEAAMGEGRMEEARALLTRDLEICRATNHETERLATLRRFVALLLKLREFAEAATRLAEAKEVLAQVPSRFESAMLEALEADIVAAQDDRPRAIDLLRSAARTLAALRRFDLQLDALARRGLLELEDGRPHEARASLVEARDLMVRHEVHRFPRALADLEERVGDRLATAGATAPGVEQRITTLADLLRLGGPVESGQWERVLRMVGAALESEEVHWVRPVRTLSCVRGEFGVGPAPPDLDARLKTLEADRGADAGPESGWIALRTGGADPGWLAVRRQRPVDEGERAFLQAVAGAVGLAHGALDAGRWQGALRTIAAGLGCEKLYWQRSAGTLSCIDGTLSYGPQPVELEGVLDGLKRAATQHPEEVVTDGRWSAVPTRGADPGWLVVWRDTPLDRGEVAFLRGAAEAMTATTRAAVQRLRSDGTTAVPFSPGARYGIIGHSPALEAVLHMIDLVKDNDLTILLLGENGTGKDLVARAIHQVGARRKGEFVAVNCASIPASLLESELFGHEKGAFTDAIDRHVGMFERANGGTIFLDEIAEMPLAMQAKLLRVLQEKSFTRVGGVRTIHSDARVIAATNRDLAGEVAANRFRMDLFYRLNVISIQIPALRERVSDIKPLVEHFLERFAVEFRSNVRGISEEAIARLSEYRWPGNVRELENVVKNAMVFAGRDVIRVEDLPATVLGRGAARTHANVSDVVRTIVRADDYSEERPLMPQLELLIAHEVVKAVGNKARAARLLGITKPTLYDRLRRFEAAYGRRETPGQDPLAGDEGGVDEPLGGRRGDDRR